QHPRDVSRLPPDEMSLQAKVSGADRDCRVTASPCSTPRANALEAALVNDGARPTSRRRVGARRVAPRAWGQNGARETPSTAARDARALARRDARATHAKAKSRALADRDLRARAAPPGAWHDRSLPRVRS